jgi:hypothetical protein
MVKKCRKKFKCKFGPDPFAPFIYQVNTGEQLINIKSRIVYNNAVSDLFDCNNGVRQGENLSPFLFSMY